MRERTSISSRRACQLVGIARSVLAYQPACDPGDAALAARIAELAAERRRFGYRRIHALLRREGVCANDKRVFRIYREAGLAVQRWRRRRRTAIERQPWVAPQGPNEIWSMDFVMDALSSGRRLKCLTVVDDFTKEAIEIFPEHSIPGLYVTRILDQAALLRGLPKTIRTDQGPEFTGRALDQWAYRNGVELRLIEAGKPVQNAYVESFNGKFRDECLNEHWFISLIDARHTIEIYRRDYNGYRPHSSLGGLTPEEFARRAAALQAPPAPSDPQPGTINHAVGLAL
jgi:putative transposase